ncbi:MAG: amino acid permease [Ignavibacteriales bacterium]|nr:amino acid permease [Ignavibacteriales bacterium]
MSVILSTTLHFMPFVGNIFPFNDIGPKFVAILSIIFLTIVNYIGVMFGGVVQTVVTYIKIISIVALALLLLIFGSGNLANLVTDSQLSNNGQNIFIMIGLALSGAFWAYDGWNNVTFISGEIKNPQINVPKALLTGTLIVMFTYVLINAAYLYILPIDEMSNSPLVAASAIEKLFGSAGGAIISIAVIISTFGALNGSLLASARVPFAMAREKLFFKRLGDIHPKYATPTFHLSCRNLVGCVSALRFIRYYF